MGFDKMSMSDLRKYINGCHAAGCFDSSFEAACRVWNDKFQIGPNVKEIHYLTECGITQRLSRPIRCF